MKKLVFFVGMPVRLDQLATERTNGSECCKSAMWKHGSLKYCPQCGKECAQPEFDLTELGSALTCSVENGALQPSPLGMDVLIWNHGFPVLSNLKPTSWLIGRKIASCKSLDSWIPSFTAQTIGSVTKEVVELLRVVSITAGPNDVALHTILQEDK